jgi:hypothetical protein
MGAGVTSPAAGTYLMATSGGGTLTPVPNAAQGYVFYFDPADRTANTRGNKYRVRGQVIVNAVAPTTNWTIGLYPVATWGGASGSSPTVATLGTVVAGSTIAFNAPRCQLTESGQLGRLHSASSRLLRLGGCELGRSSGRLLRERFRNPPVQAGLSHGTCKDIRKRWNVGPGRCQLDRGRLRIPLLVLTRTSSSGWAHRWL